MRIHLLFRLMGFGMVAFSLSACPDGTVVKKAESSRTKKTSSEEGDTEDPSSSTTSSVTKPSSMSYSAASIDGYIGSAISLAAPSTSPSSGLTFSVTPDLPTGVTLNTSTGAISGTPTAALTATSYTIKAANELGSVSTSVSITVSNPVQALGANLAVWLDASNAGSVTTDSGGTTAATNGDTVIRWSDRSGNGKNFLRTVTSPTILYSSAAIGGKPAVRFQGQINGGTAGGMCMNPSGSACAATVAENRTVFAVFKPIVNTNYWQYVYSNRDSGYVPATQTDLVFGGPSITDAAQTLSIAGNGDKFIAYPTQIDILQKEIITVHHSYAAAAKIMYLGASLDHWIGFNGYIGEFIITHGVVSSAEQERIVNYLSQKYSIDISSKYTSP